MNLFHIARFGAHGSRIPSEVHNQLYPLTFGRQNNTIPGADARINSNVIDIPNAGTVAHFKVTDSRVDTIRTIGHTAALEGVFGAMITLSGNGTVRFGGSKRIVLNECGSLALCSSNEVFMRATIAPGSSFEIVNLICGGGFIRDIMDGRRGPKILKKELAGGLFGKINVTEQPYSPVMKKIARDVSMNPYHGSMETLYLQGKTFEFLAELARIDQDEGKTKDMPRKVTLSKAADAMDILLANPQNPPSPVDLAKAVGVSYSTLKRGFRKYYGQSIYQFANGASLDHAKRILDEMDKTVAEVAYQHGYANPSAFITAFTRRFGYTPGAMKKKGL